MKQYTPHFIITVMLALMAATTAPAQIRLGDAVVTCDAPTAGDYVFGYVRVQDANAQPHNTNWNAPMHHHWSWIRSRMGRIFGLALDEEGNAYVTAGNVYSAAPPSPWYGPAGPGGIYRIDGASGVVTDWVTTVNSSTANTVGTQTLPNTGPGLGNICYDRDHDQFFVTNFEDGRIYRINSAGLVLSRHDPFNADGGSVGYAPRDERLWGIGYYNNRVYFSVWRTDCGVMFNTLNKVWSIALNGAGDFTGTARFEFDAPRSFTPNITNPISDIEFSTTGSPRMLIAERTMVGDAVASGHSARLLSFTLSGGSWVPTPGVSYELGDGNLGSNAGPPCGTDFRNACGGCDFGYGWYDKTNRRTVTCDSTVWATGDALHYVAGDYIYGLQRLPAAGGTRLNSILIDLNGVLNGSDKTASGDVDIYKGCTITNSCGQLSHTFTADASKPGQCCWNLTITNNDAANFWTSFQLAAVSEGVVFTSATPPGTWASELDTSLVTFRPATGYIPLGTTGTFSVCILPCANPPQKMTITWRGRHGETCIDTLTTNCPRTCGNTCGELRSIALSCNEMTPTSTSYAMSFQVRNNHATQNFSKATIIVRKPLGATVNPNTLTFSPALAPSGTSSTRTITINGGKPGDTLCLTVRLSYGAFPFSTHCSFDTCVVLPKCKSCCDPLRLTINNAKVSRQTGGRLFTANISANYPLRSFSATLMYVNRLAICFPISRTTGPNIITNATFPTAPPLPGPTGFNNARVTWGTNAAGVTATNVPFSLSFTPLGKLSCPELIQVCIAFSFQDTACRACDTTICIGSTVIGTPFPNSASDIQPPRFETFRDGGEGHGIKEDESARPQSAPGTGLPSITMTSSTAGTLRITNVPYESIADSIPAIDIVGLEFEPEVGIDITALTDMSTDLSADIVDRVASIEQLESYINPGSTREFQLTYANPNGVTSFVNSLRVYFATQQNPEERFEMTVPVFARTPGADNGDSLLRDKSISLTNVRTYGLKFTNGNANDRPICRIEVRVASAGDDIIAVGPGLDRTAVAMRAYLKPDSKTTLLAEPPEPGNAIEATIPPDATITPIYVTVCGGEDGSVTFAYTTYDADGAIVSEGEVTDDAPLETHRSGVPFTATSGGAIPLISCAPNPAASTTTFSFTLPAADEQVSLVVTDARGSQVASVIEGRSMPAGYHEIRFDLSALPSGSYYYTLETTSFTQTRALNIVR